MTISSKEGLSERVGDLLESDAPVARAQTQREAD